MLNDGESFKNWSADLLKKNFALKVMIGQHRNNWFDINAQFSTIFLLTWFLKENWIVPFIKLNCAFHISNVSQNERIQVLAMPQYKSHWSHSKLGHNLVKYFRRYFAKETNIKRNSVSQPVHSYPLPSSPTWQLQLKAPSVSVQVALEEQLCVCSSHSLISRKSYIIYK